MSTDTRRWAMLTWRFARRDLSNRFSGSLAGALWALAQPLLQLAITSFVFVNVFKARVPGAEGLGYVPFLAVALWPWFAFSEAVLRSATTIQDNASLIGKVALPREILVWASVLTTVAIHFVGFIAVVIVLVIARQGIHLVGIVPAMLLFLPLTVFALGCALMFAAVQVFVRDLVQALGQLLPLLMFSAPIYYDRLQLPERFRGVLDFNPYTWYAESFRALLLGHGSIDYGRTVIAILSAIAVFGFGRWLFRRLDPHFEDFL